MLPHNAKLVMNKKGDQELVINKKGKPSEHTLNELDEITNELVEEIVSPLPNPSAEYAISSEMPTEYRDANRPPFNELDSFEMDPIIVGNDIGTAVDRMEENDKTRANHDEISNWAPGQPGSAEINPLEGKSLDMQEMDIPTRNYYTAEFVDKNTNNPVQVDRDKYSDLANECVSSTAGIATGVMNNFFGTGRQKMKSRRKMLREYAPDFEAGNYKPGDPKMKKPTGEGLATKTPTQLGFGKTDTEMHEVGEPLGRKRKHNVAMGQVAEDGVEDEAPTHLSEPGDPLDVNDEYMDIALKEVHHNWPAAPKNKGGIEPFPGSRWNDGGELTGGQVKGDSSVNEEWSPEKLSLLVEGVDENTIRHLFNSWVKGIKQVRLSEFEDLLHANGIEFTMNESTFENLLAGHDKILFREGGQDANGRYWIAESSMPDFLKDKLGKKEESKEHDGACGRGEEEEHDANCGWGDEEVTEKDMPVNEDSPFSVTKKKYLTDQGNGSTNMGEVFAETDMEDHGQINTLLQGEPTNKTGETPIMPDTDVGMGVKQVKGDGAVALATLKENVNKLRDHVAPQLLRASKRISGPYQALYCVQEGKKRGKVRKNLAEALVDAEENIQFNNASDNYLIAQYRRPNGAVLFQQTIPLLTLSNRAPIMAEGKMLFRSKNNASRFSKVLKESKNSSQVDSHPYGFAVEKL